MGGRASAAEQFFDGKESMRSAVLTQNTEKPRRLRDQFREWLVFHHYSPRTADCYIGWVAKFVQWHQSRNPMSNDLQPCRCAN